MYRSRAARIYETNGRTAPAQAVPWHDRFHDSGVVVPAMPMPPRALVRVLASTAVPLASVESDHRSLAITEPTCRIMRVIRLRFGAFALAVITAATIGVAVAAATLSSHLRSATITVQNGSLPPPYGRPHVYRYTTRAAVTKVKRALNTNHIVARHPTTSAGCAGGLSVTLKLVAQTTRTLTAYECGGHNYGGIGGNVTGFLSALGISTP